MIDPAGVDNPGILDALERHRDFHFRRVASRRVTGEKSALKFIDEVGFCTGFTAGMGVPCLREAIAGTREPTLPEHIQHDYAIGMTWRIKDALPQRRAVYYGKVIARRPSFIAREMLGAFLKLRIEPGGYRKLYERGGLSHCGKLVMDTLSRRGAAETRGRLRCRNRKRHRKRQAQTESQGMRSDRRQQRGRGLRRVWRRRE